MVFNFYICVIFKNIELNCMKLVFNMLLYILERRLDQCPDRALLVWSPTTDIPDQKRK